VGALSREEKEVVHKKSDGVDVIVVGSGIAALMTAYYASKHGFSVQVISMSPDPRLSHAPDPFSSTFGGEDSRFITVTEGHPYLGTNAYVNEMYPDMQGAFTKPLTAGGWLGQSEHQYRIEDRDWLRERYLANEQAHEIQQRFNAYVEENRASLTLWCELWRADSHLTRGIDLDRDGVLRVYGSEGLWQMAGTFHEQQGVLRERIAIDQTVKRFPFLKDAVATGKIAGCLVVEGYAFRVQVFLRNLINSLQKDGVQFNFNLGIQDLEWAAADVLGGIKDAHGKIWSAQHYSFQLGAHDIHRLRKRVHAADTIAGVAGGWILFPCPADFTLPMKVHDGIQVVDGTLRPVVDLNLKPVLAEDGRRWLIVGGGYLFVGRPPFQIDPANEMLMYAEIKRVCQRFLPAAYETAHASGEIILSNRVCVRSFTPNDQELCYQISTAKDGIALFEGGGNTGTTTKAPFRALASIERFRGKNAAGSIQLSVFECPDVLRTDRGIRR
jgi:glycine/D-amino acid oxidase-like deaminating enzyme